VVCGLGRVRNMVFWSTGNLGGTRWITIMALDGIGLDAKVLPRDADISVGDNAR
jgi:hypothetical protein